MTFIIICIIILIFKFFEFLFNRIGNKKLQNDNKLKNDNKLGGTIYKNKLKCQLLLDIILNLIKQNCIDFIVNINDFNINVKNNFCYININDIDVYNIINKFNKINKENYLQNNNEYIINAYEYDENKLAQNFNEYIENIKNNIKNNINKQNKVIEVTENKDNIIFKKINIYDFINNDNIKEEIKKIENFDEIKNNNNVKLILYNIYMFELFKNNLLINYQNYELIEEYLLLNINKNKNENLEKLFKFIKYKKINNDNKIYFQELNFNNIKILMPFDLDFPEFDERSFEKKCLKKYIKLNKDFFNNNNIKKDICYNYDNNDIFIFKNKYINKLNSEIKNNEVEENNKEYLNFINLHQEKVFNKLEIINQEEIIKLINNEIKENIFNLLDIIDFLYDEYKFNNIKLNEIFVKQINNIAQKFDENLTIFNKIDYYKFYFDNIDYNKNENAFFKTQEIYKKITPKYLYFFDFVWMNMQENLQGEKIYLIIDLLKETISENTNEQKLNFDNIDFKSIDFGLDSSNSITKKYFSNNESKNDNNEYDIIHMKNNTIISFHAPGHAMILIIQKIKETHINLYHFNPYENFDSTKNKKDDFSKYLEIFINVFKKKNEQNNKKINVISSNFVSYKNLQNLFESQNLSNGMCLLTTYLFVYFYIYISLYMEINENNFSIINKYIYYYFKNELFTKENNYFKNNFNNNQIIETKEIENEDDRKNVLDENIIPEKYLNNNEEIFSNYENFLINQEKIFINKNLLILNKTEEQLSKINFYVNIKNQNKIETQKNKFNKINFILNFGLLLIKKYVKKEMIIYNNFKIIDDNLFQLINYGENNIINFSIKTFLEEYNLNYIDYKIDQSKIICKKKNTIIPYQYLLLLNVNLLKIYSKIDILYNWKNWNEYDIFTWLIFIVFKNTFINFNFYRFNNSNEKNHIQNLYDFVYNFSLLFQKNNENKFLSENLNLENIFLRENIEKLSKYHEYENILHFIFNILEEKIFVKNLFSLYNYNIDHLSDFKQSIHNTDIKNGFYLQQLEFTTK